MNGKKHRPLKKGEGSSRQKKKRERESQREVYGFYLSVNSEPVKYDRATRGGGDLASPPLLLTSAIERLH